MSHKKINQQRKSNSDTRNQKAEYDNNKKKLEIVLKCDSMGSEEAISEEDVKLVAEQAEVTEDKAREALTQCKGDIAEAILKLSEAKE